MAMGGNGSSGSSILLQSCLLALACLLPWSFCASRHQNIVNDDILHAVSGAVGSALSITLLYPLETIRTRLQVDASLTPNSSFFLIYNIGRKEGIRGLYRGWFSLVVALVSLNFIYFYFFYALRRWATAQSESFNKVTIDLIAGYCAGVIAVLGTGPLWLVNTRLKLQGVDFGRASDEVSKMNKTQQYTGIFHCMYKITHDDGILTLWNGTTTSIVLAWNPAINLGVYMMLKRHHLIIGASDISNGGALEAFVNALLSKFIATVVTYPIQVLQTRHRAGIKQDEEDKQSTRSASWFSLLLGMYRGLESKLLQTCLNSALMFVVYERIVKILTTLTKLKDETVQKS
mmetsp:Transcript_13393/g.28973  ORF Transcript_13393/g.28973 Transcript_13393/m.28973 type:complete len:345 (+) Transcript_13393:61-1095(+)